MIADSILTIMMMIGSCISLGSNMNSRDMNWTSVHYHMFPNIIIAQNSTSSNWNISVRHTENAEQSANTHVLTRKF